MASRMLRLVLGFALAATCLGFQDDNDGFYLNDRTDKDRPFDEHDLLLAIKIPFLDTKTQFFITGSDGFPAFGIKPGSDIKSPYRLLLPEKLYPEFSIRTIVRPTSRHAGYIFAVVNPLDLIVQLGLKIQPAGINTNISLVFTDTNETHKSHYLASFLVPDFTNEWTSFAIRAVPGKVTLFFKCQEHSSVTVQRPQQELTFDSASTLYIGQAGPVVKGDFDGALQELKLFGTPDLAEGQCENNFQDLGSGDGQDVLSDTNVPDVDGGDAGGKTHIPPFPPPPPGIDDGYWRGEKGERGPRGPPGESIRGPPGPPGPAGPPGIVKGTDGVLTGPPGPPGVCSCNFTTLIESYVTPNLIPGPPGPAGADGKAGPPGITGLPGTPGERGAIGPKGEKGDRGEGGAPGPEGQQGPKGDAGRDGLPGLPGAAGPPGPPGPVEFENFDPSWKPRGILKETVARSGPPGSKGDLGPSGPPGPRGERGVQGSKGTRGEPGTKGDRGERGHSGERGAQGSKGEPGEAGMDGIPGLPGENGRPAEKGEKGEPGKLGPPGPPGMSVYSVNGDGGGPPVLGQSGPKGEPGDTGIKGEKGERGDPGPGGFPGLNGSPGAAGEKGEPGKDGDRGVPGLKGERGERGPPGPVTIADSGAQIVTVKGEKGELGKRGRRGKQGPAGPMGPPGKSGPGDGFGRMGRPGTPGSMGHKGEKGDPGDFAGGRGEKGEKGDAGQDGIPGAPGLPGGSDSAQFIPVPGPPGPPGPPGFPGPPGVSIVGPKGEPGEGRHVFGEPTYTNTRPPGMRSSLDEALRELKQLKETKDQIVTSAPPFQELELTTRIVPGAVTFKDRDLMIKMSNVSPVGTIAYVIEEEALLVRVNNGWQYVALGSLLPITTPAPPTTAAPQMRPPFEASNLINNIPQPVDGPNWHPKMLRMAALNEAYTGDVHGIRGADYSCYRQARRAGLRGTYRAFLSSRVQNVDAIVRLADRELPVVNLRGDVLFNSWSDMFRGDGAPFPHPPRILSFSGKNVLMDMSWPVKAVWHGALVSGERALDTSCDAWHTSSRDKMGLAGSLRGPRLLEQSPYPCDAKLVLLCIEVTSQPTPQRRRRELDRYEYQGDDLLSEEEYQLLLETIDKDTT